MNDPFPEPSSDEHPGPASAPTVIFEDLTLADALRYLFWRPARTARLLWAVLTCDAEGEREAPPVVEAPPPDDWPDEDEPPAPEPEILDAPAEPRDSALWLRAGALLAAIPLALIGGSQLYAAAIDPVAHSAGRTNGAFWWLGLAAALATGVELYAARGWWLGRFRRWTAVPARVDGSGDAAVEADGEAVFHVRSVMIDTSAPAPAAQRSRARTGWLQAHTPALALILIALALAGLGWRANVLRAADGTPLDVVLTLHGAVFWLLSVALWATVFLVDWPSRRWRTIPLRARGARPWWRRSDGLLIAAALLAITALGAYFRLHDLDATPPEMTSDHIEKLLDALRVSEGHTAVFFPNNGGREGFQMWVVAFIADTLGVGFNFRALKLATAFEGIVTLPVLWWMARQVIGTDTPRARRLGQWVGLALAGLVAISAWHVMLSRLGLRIVLTPLTTALVIGFLARAMRYGRARDFVALGLVLGAGVYFYQANRMLPALAVIGVALAVLGSIRRWRDLPRTLAEGIGLALAAGLPLLAYWLIALGLEQSARDNLRQLGEQLKLLFPLAAAAWLAIVALAARAWPDRPALRYGGGLLAAAVIALALYVPLYRYSALHPDEFWNRTRGRMFGEEAFWRVDPATGIVAAYEPSPVEQIERVWEKREVLAGNYADALRMAHWEGDGAWINNAHSRPALDGLSGGLVILGLALWAVRLARRADPVDWLVPAALLVMLLPSALTLAYTIENPSFTRASGAIPAVFLLAALPLGALGAGLTEAPRTRRGAWIGALGGLAAIGLVLALAVGPNWTHFFTDYRLSYNQSWKPYHAIAAPLKAFAQGEGGYGNAFMVAYPHWLDHRILGAVAGDLRWPNGLVTREELPARIAANAGTPYAYDPARPLFVMVHPQDTETIAYLEDLLPGGTTQVYTYTYETEAGTQTGDFLIYTVRAGEFPSR
ncbi:MAG: hypothetical protein AAGU78_10935 [Chloroflexota bacterium]